MRKDFILTENAYGKERYDAPTSKYEQTLLLTDSVTKFLLLDSVEILSSCSQSKVSIFEWVQWVIIDDQQLSLK